MKKRVVSILMSAAMISAMAAGCGSTGSDNAGAGGTGGDSSSESESGVTSYTVVTASTYAPFCYLDENDELTGYDVAIMQAIDEYDDTIEFTYEWCDWSSMLPGLDAGRYDVCVYEMGKTEEREEMYHFGEVPYSNSAGGGVITTTEHSDWDSFEAIAAAGDAVIGCIVGSNFTTYVEDYLEENPDAFTVQYYDSEIDAVMEDIVNGRIDATINDGSVAMARAESSGLADELMVSGYVTDPSPVWAVYPQSDRGEELSAKVDAAVRALYADGTLAEIATEWLGDDYVITTLADTGYFD